MASRRSDALHFAGLAVLSQNLRKEMEERRGVDALATLDHLQQRINELRPEVEQLAGADEQTEHYPTMAGCVCGWRSPAVEGEHPCKNGHFDCANTYGGACANEWAAAAFERHQKEVTS